MAAYQPVECGLHSEYELAIMQGRVLQLSWEMPNGQTRSIRVKPIDIFTRNHEEFLLVTYHGEQEEIRLDRIISIE